MTQGWREPWWIPAESPGGIGDPEVWIDAQALDEYGGKDPRLAASVLAGNGGGPWIGALLKFGRVPHDRVPQQVPDTDYPDSITYMVVARRFSAANAGRPYYVARVPAESPLPRIRSVCSSSKGDGRRDAVGLPRREDVRVAGDTGWDELEAGDELRAEVPGRSPVTEVYPGGRDPGATVRSYDQVRAEQYSVGPQEAP